MRYGTHLSMSSRYYRHLMTVAFRFMI